MPPGVAWASSIDSNLYVGAWEARRLVGELGIGCVFSILTAWERTDRNYPSELPAGVVEHSYDIDDASGVKLAPLLEDCLPKLHRALARSRVLVHCAAGVSRSPSVVMAYLITHRGLAYFDAFACLRAARPWVAPKPGFVTQLQALPSSTKETPAEPAVLETPAEAEAHE